MTLVVPDNGEIVALTKFVQASERFRLYTNVLDPTDGTHGATGEAIPNAGTAGGPVECTFSGYTAGVLTASNWVVTSTSGLARATYPTLTFSFSESATLHGYYVTDGSGTTLWMEMFDGAPITVPAGNQITVVPRIDCD